MATQVSPEKTTDAALSMIHRFPLLPSTNDEALRLARAGAPAFEAVVADAQSAGRGRAGHAWSSPPGVALYFSVVLRPRLDAAALPLVTIACGIGVAEAVRSATGLDARLKWPNDVLVNGRKCAGILCEGDSGPDGPVVVAGVGLNVNTPAEALPERPIFPATSLLLESGAPQDRERVLSACLDGIARWCARLEAPDGSAAVVARFRECDALRGRRVRVALPDGSFACGEELGCAPSGALLVAGPDGPREILAGSVALER